MNKKIVMIVGSLRRNSFNMAASKIVAQRLGEKGIEVEYLPVDSVPLLNTDLEANLPESLQRAYRTIAASDGIWIFSPENNAQIPGGLKNLLDWLSRNNPQFGAVLKNRKVAVTSVAGGSAGANVRARLADFMNHPYVMAQLMPNPLGLRNTPESWQTDHFSPTAEDLAALKAQADEFVDFIK